jgi:hypothetical protein
MGERVEKSYLRRKRSKDGLCAGRVMGVVW